MFEWERYRNEDRTLDLTALWCSQFYDYENAGVKKATENPKFWKAIRWLGRVERKYKVRSRKAALAIFARADEYIEATV